MRIGPVLLEVTYPTQPCQRMEEAYRGLAQGAPSRLARRHHGRVIEGGTVRLGDEVAIVVSPPESNIRLPG